MYLFEVIDALSQLQLYEATRSNHRPSYYVKENDDMILISRLCKESLYVNRHAYPISLFTAFLIHFSISFK